MFAHPQGQEPLAVAHLPGAANTEVDGERVISKGGDTMEKMIAYCGLVCTDCPAYIATQENDQEALQKVAEQWSKEFNATLTAEDVLCDGCLTAEGQHIGHWSECKVRACAAEKKVRNCAHCSDYVCEELENFFSFAPEAKSILEGIRKNL
jgi:hypothetical protein